MGARTVGRVLAVTLACGAWAAPASADEGQGREKASSKVRQESARNEAAAEPRGIRALLAQRPSRPYQEPAFAAGYERGLESGRKDGREGQRYDPVRHAEYRDADEGYTPSYGARDAYRNNYRAGFRKGYEEGYRDGVRK